MLHHRNIIEQNFAEAFDERRFSYQKIFLLRLLLFACVESVCVVATIVRRIMCFLIVVVVFHCVKHFIFVGYIFYYTKCPFMLLVSIYPIYLIQILIPFSPKRISSVAESKDLHKHKIYIYIYIYERIRYGWKKEKKEYKKKMLKEGTVEDSLTRCNHNSLIFKDTVKDLCDLISSVIFYYGTILRSLLLLYENISNRQNAWFSLTSLRTT